jgi:hypothetical protein
MRARRGTIRAVGVSILGMLSVIWLGGLSAWADPPGNNGTVKVAGGDMSTGGNDSHVGCAFAVDFYGFDEGDLYADLTIEGQAPTSGGLLWIDRVFIGEDVAGGGTDLDASAWVDFSAAFAGTPQGVHVKLTVNADGSHGADTKHKTFWVDCASGEGGGEGEGGGGEGGE